MLTIRALLLLLLLAAVAVPAQGAPARPSTPQAPLTFKVEVNYVEIDVTVTDAQGRPLEDLSREDFQVSEEGKPQELTLFSRVQIPVERARGDGFGHARSIALKEFPPGRYVLRVEARALVADAPTVSRGLEFTVR